MLVIPAIDLREGNCVRLVQGRKEAVTIYSHDPAATARKWELCGAELLHIVDLDGAFSGNQKNMDAILKIRRAVKMALQVGGGIRNIGNLLNLFSAGIDRIIIGTAAIEDPAFLVQACKQYPGRVLIGIDAKDGMVAIKGWEEVTEILASDLAKRLEMVGIAGIIYTDIKRDGMLTGPNINAVRDMVNHVSIPVIASGGIASMEDVRNLAQIKGLWGMITGKAIYSGSLNLKQAIEFVSRQAC
jgi:phosphoribosylformimino-5-aminoimidazole carboxamide ribotide isomerase